MHAVLMDRTIDLTHATCLLCCFFFLSASMRFSEDRGSLIESSSFGCWFLTTGVLLNVLLLPSYRMRSSLDKKVRTYEDQKLINIPCK